MPLLKGAASDITVYRRANATNTADPEKKSRTFVAPNKYVIAPLVRTSDWAIPGNLNIGSQGSLQVAYTGSDQVFVVPNFVTYLDIALYGAGGAAHGGGSPLPGGAGGYVSGRLPVTPGETLTLVVGGGGVGNVGGYGGGGTGWSTQRPTNNTPGGGGGRTAIRRGNTDVATAGGGGGAGLGVGGGTNAPGGAGGGTSGTQGYTSAINGGGGTPSAGGAAGAATTEVGVAGSQYQGGNGAAGVYTGLSLSNAVGGNMTITGTIAAITNGATSGFYVTVSGSSSASLNGSWVVVSWAANSVVVTTGVTSNITGITGATMKGNNNDTGGGGGGYYGGGGGGIDTTGNYGGAGGGGSSYIALLSNAVTTIGGGAAGGAAVNTQQPGGNGSCSINWIVTPYKFFKSPPFNGRVYIT